MHFSHHNALLIRTPLCHPFLKVIHRYTSEFTTMNASICIASLGAVLQPTEEARAPDPHQTPQADTPATVQSFDSLPLPLPPWCLAHQRRRPISL